MALHSKSGLFVASAAAEFNHRWRGENACTKRMKPQWK